MSTTYGSTTSNYWRAYMTYSTSKSNTSYTVSLSELGVHANGGWFNYPDFSGTISATGQSSYTWDQGRVNISSGEYKQFNGSTYNFVWTRGTSSSDKTIKWTVHNSYTGTSSTASATITVPALDKFTITFYNGSSKYATRSVYYGKSPASFPDPNPSKTGYKFLGWYTASSGGDKKTVNSTFTKDTSLYAHWEPYKATINFKSNGGSISSSPHKYTTSDGVTYYFKLNNSGQVLSSSTSSGTYDAFTQSLTTEATYKNLYDVGTFGITKTGYHITGSSAYGITAAGGTLFTQSDSSSNETHKVTTKRLNGGTQLSEDHTFTLYINWIANTYTVKYNANGGTGTTANSSHTYGVSKALTSNGFSKTGYSFYGWADTQAKANAGTRDYTNGQSVSNLTATNDGTVTLYAIWTPRIYPITLNKNGGSNGTDTIYVKYNTGWYSDDSASASTSSITRPTRTGYDFSGYYTTASGGTQIINSNGTILSGHTDDFTQTTTLYAHWTEKTATLTYNTSRGTAPAAVTMRYTAQTTAASMSKVSGYKFKGWATTSNGSVAYTAGSIVKATKVVPVATPLYAVWEQDNTYTLTANANGGIIESVPPNLKWGDAGGKTVTRSELKTNDTYNTLPTATYDNHLFKGWFASATGTVQVNSNTTIKNSSATIYAQWVQEIFNPTIKNFSAKRGNIDGNTFTPDPTGTVVQCTFTIVSGVRKDLNGNSTSPTTCGYLIKVDGVDKINGSYTNGTSQTVTIDDNTFTFAFGASYTLALVATDSYGTGDNIKIGTTEKGTFISAGNFLLDGYKPRSFIVTCTTTNRRARLRQLTDSSPIDGDRLFANATNNEPGIYTFVRSGNTFTLNGEVVDIYTNYGINYWGPNDVPQGPAWVEGEEITVVSPGVPEGTMQIGLGCAADNKFYNDYINGIKINNSIYSYGDTIKLQPSFDDTNETYKKGVWYYANKKHTINGEQKLISVGMGVGRDGINYGLYTRSHDKWIIYGNNNPGEVHINAGTASNTYVAGKLIVQGHSSPIGTVVENQNSSAIVVPSGTVTTLMSITLDPGVWIIRVLVRFPAMGTDRTKYCSLHLTTATTTTTYLYRQPCENMITQIPFTQIVSPDTTTTYNVLVYHNSGSDKTFVTGSAIVQNIRAIRIA